MALYSDPTRLKQSSSTEFNKVHVLGRTVPHSGIYECSGCGDEIAANRGDPFPPQNTHQHPNRNLPVAWKLIVATEKVS